MPRPRCRGRCGGTEMVVGRRPDGKTARYEHPARTRYDCPRCDSHISICDDGAVYSAQWQER